MFGFRERNYEAVRKQFRLEEDDAVLVSLANGRRFYVGEFETPTLEQLDDRLDGLLQTVEITKSNECYSINGLSGLKFNHIVADVKKLHMDPLNEDAVFQAASQFNCLEMPNPNVTPDDGITDYINDHTQGPICAMSCAAGTIYRNYFVNKYGQGGKKGQQIDCLEEMGDILENRSEEYWKMRNGYALPTKSDSMARLKLKIYRRFLLSREPMKLLKVGVHWSTEVTNTALANNNDQPSHQVTQVYSSAVPISYASIGKMRDFEPFAKMILDATYQCVFAVASIKSLETKKRVKLYLTKVGGGVFGNRSRWIVDSIRRSLKKYEDFPLDVHLVHYGSLEQTYVEYLKGSEEVDLISDFILSNIDTSKLSSSSTFCSSSASSNLPIGEVKSEGNEEGISTECSEIPKDNKIISNDDINNK